MSVYLYSQKDRYREYSPGAYESMVLCFEGGAWQYFGASVQKGYHISLFMDQASLLLLASFFIWHHSVLEGPKSRIMWWYHIQYFSLSRLYVAVTSDSLPRHSTLHEIGPPSHLPLSPQASIHAFFRVNTNSVREGIRLANCDGRYVVFFPRHNRYDLHRCPQ